jgi:hypothetical protein
MIFCRITEERIPLVGFSLQTSRNSRKISDATRRREIADAELTLLGTGAKGTGPVMKKEDQFPKIF